MDKNVEKPIADNAKTVVKRKCVPAKTAAQKATDTNANEKATEKKATQKKSAEKKPAQKKATQKKTEPTKKHVLYVCSEAQPFAGTGGLSDVIGSLPAALNRQKAGVEVRVVLPLYEGMNADMKSRLEFLFCMNIPVAWRNQYCGVLKLEHEGVTFYFLDNEYYFKRQNIYGYYDDGERFTFLSRAALEILPRLDWHVDVLHCHDWHTALVPIYYKLFYQYREGLGGIKTVFTIHNIEYQGKFGRNIMEDVLGIPDAEYPSLEFDGCVNLVKGAIDYSDVVTTVSPTYAGELNDAYFAHGLDGIICKNSYKMVGILNGIDINYNNPATNASLFENYDAKSIQKKCINKTELQKMIGLPEAKDTPLIAIVSRLVPHKGLDLLKSALHSVLTHDVQLVILGTGMPSYEEYFSHIQVEFGSKISTIIAFNKDLSQKIYAGADIFLMPSKSEPCGLSQMIAMRYGTVPIVRATGGLRDSVVDASEEGGTGFVFHDYDVLAFSMAVDRAIAMYYGNKAEFGRLIQNAMAADFSWNSSAAEYLKLYLDK